MKNLIIYDLDGTLVDTREDIALAANHMLRELKLPELSHSEISGFVGRGVFYLISNCLKSQDLKLVEKGIRLYRDYYAKHMLDHSVLFPGAREILDYYRAQKQIVMTNKPDPFSTNMLKALGVAEYLSQIIAGDTVYPKKPDPQGILAMMEQYKVNAAGVLFIGDSLIDIETARNAGVPIAVLTHGFSDREQLQSQAPELIADSFTELLQILKQKGW